ncbi:hypothetical protein HHI36_021877 [Cryptolaemus montrouzieri]|uniref:Cytochrome P450 n=1 Tax=Cryptolaemus montrouzieri TaxID=559131 RepID=A0ABD2MY15_9CUCU
MDLVTLIFTLILVVIVTTIFTKLKSMKDREFLETIPGPKPYPILGNVLDFKSTTDIIRLFMKYMTTYGDVVQLWLGSKLKILISDHDVLEALLTSTKNITKESDYVYLDSWLGKGLLTSGPTRWKKHRKIITPAFHFQILEKFVAIFERSTLVLIKKLKEQQEKKNLDIYPLVDLCTLDIICETSMGTTVNAQENENSEYVTAVSEMGRIVCEKSFSLVMQYSFLYRFTETYRKEKAALKILHDYTHHVIQQRKDEILKTQATPDTTEGEFFKKTKMNFLDIMLLSKVDGEPLSDEAIREEVDTFMFEGHDTTASGLSFALYCLANHPEVQQSAVDEQIELFGKHKDPEIQLNDLQNMKYLDLVVKETLRLYPSVPSFGRLLTEDIKVGDQLFLKELTFW